MKYALTDIPGIGESTAALLAGHGIDSVKVLLKGGGKKLSRVPGFGEARTAKVLAAAAELMDGGKAAEKAVRQADKAEARALKLAEKEAGKVAKAEARAIKKAKKEAAKVAKAEAKVAKKAAKSKG